MSDWTKQTLLQTGLYPPLQCARGRTDCRSLAQIISTGDEPDGERTFICCGEVAPGASPFPRDQWSFCLRGDQGRPGVAGTDARFFIDRRDMSHMAGVLAMGLATITPPDPDPPELVTDK